MRGVNYRMGIESDSEKTAAVLLSWILNIVSNNKELVDTVLTALVGDKAFVKSILKFVLNFLTAVMPHKLTVSLLSRIFTAAKFFMNLFVTLQSFVNNLIR